MKSFAILSFFVFNVLFGFSQIPADYYESASGFGGDGLKTALYNIIKGHTEYEYTTDTTDVWDILKETDRDPNNPDSVVLLYTGWSAHAEQEFNDGSGWSREHVWAKSHGQFDPDIVGPGAGTDVHHLRPADISVNTIKNNRWFAECTEEYIDPDGATGCYRSTTEWLWKPRDEVKGDVARMMFYMATRYEGENGEPDLELIDFIPTDNNSPLPEHAKLSDLLAWHLEDPVDAWERDRNEIIYSYQNNANPFIDHPEWVECIWNNACSGLWYTSYPVTNLTDREDYSYSVSALSSEALGLTITSETTLPAWLSFTSVTSEPSSATATLSGSPEFSDIGTYPVSLKLSDGTIDVYQNFTIVVIDGNPITFTSNPIKDGIAGELYNYNITVTGDGGAVFNLTGTQLPIWLSLTNNTGDAATLTGTPAIEDIGLHSVILTVTDDTKKTITQEFDINVIHPDDANTIIISQYYEGNSNDKYIEITNVGNFNLDLGAYYLGRWSSTDTPSGPYANGDALSGTINAGQTLIYKNAGAVNPAYAANSAYATTTATYYNGNDPIALLKGGDTWDDRVDCLYGLFSVDEYWGDENGFYRNANITVGNKNSSVLDGTGEWTEISIDDANNAIEETSEYLGYHIFDSPVIEISDLSVVKTVDNASPNVGETIVFTLTVTNNGPNDATGVVLNDLLPTGYTYVSDDGGGAYISGTGIWTIGNILNTETAILNITVTVNSSGIYANTASVIGIEDDTNPDNNSDTNTPSVISAIDLLSGTNSQVKLYPNPVNNFLFVETENQINSIEIYTVTDQLIKQISSSSRKQMIETHAFKKGVYILKLYDLKAGVSVLKFIKQ